LPQTPAKSRCGGSSHSRGDQRHGIGMLAGRHALNSRLRSSGQRATNASRTKNAPRTSSRLHELAQPRRRPSSPASRRRRATAPLAMGAPLAHYWELREARVRGGRSAGGLATQLQHEVYAALQGRPGWEDTSTGRAAAAEAAGEDTAGWDHDFGGAGQEVKLREAAQQAKCRSPAWDVDLGASRKAPACAVQLERQAERDEQKASVASAWHSMKKRYDKM